MAPKASKTTPKTPKNATPKTKVVKKTTSKATPKTATAIRKSTRVSKTTSPKTPTTTLETDSSKATSPPKIHETTITPQTITNPPETTYSKTIYPQASPQSTTTPIITSETTTTLEITSPETTTTTIPQTTSPKTTTTTPDTTKTSKTAPKTTIKIKKKIVKRKVLVKRVRTKPDLPPEEEKEEKPQLPVEEENANPNPNHSIEIENPSSALTEIDTAESSDPPDQINSVSIDSGNDNDDEKEVEVENGNDDEKEVEVENENEKGGVGMLVGEEEVRASERQQRRKTEIFIGGLDRDAKDEDIRKVFEKIGEVVEIRLMMNGQTGKNKGYAFLRYASPADAKRAITEFAKVEVCGKQCGAVALEGNDTIFLGNIDKKWKKEEVMKLLQEIGIENIDTVTVTADHNNPDCNRGFAFLELETNKDAQIAYKKLQKKDVFGKGRNIKVSWAEPLREPAEEELLKVKSVYAEGIPSSWDEETVREHFKKFGEIERVALSCNLQSARRKDFAIVNYVTRESAISCIESFNKEELIDEGSKVDVKVSLAKPIPKNKQNKGGSKTVQDYFNEKPKAVNRVTNVNVLFNKGKAVRYPVNSGADKKSSTTHELIHVLRQQAAWGQGYMGLANGSPFQDYSHALAGGKRPSAALGDDMLYLDPRGYPRARLNNAFAVANSSYSTLPHNMSGASLPYDQQSVAGYAAGMHYGTTGHSSALQINYGKYERIGIQLEQQCLEGLAISFGYCTDETRCFSIWKWPLPQID